LILLFNSLDQDHFSKMMILRPDIDDSVDRLSEIAEILAVGLQRLIARQSSKLSADSGESSLHFKPDQSAAGSPTSWENP
jgi:hypothetical protein